MSRTWGIDGKSVYLTGQAGRWFVRVGDGYRHDVIVSEWTTRREAMQCATRVRRALKGGANG